MVNTVNTEGNSQSSSVCQSLSNDEVQSPSVDIPPVSLLPVPPVSLSPVPTPPSTNHLSTSPVSHSSGNVQSPTPVMSTVSVSPKQTITSLLVNQKDRVQCEYCKKIVCRKFIVRHMKSKICLLSRKQTSTQVPLSSTPLSQPPPSKRSRVR